MRGKGWETLQKEKGAGGDAMATTYNNLYLDTRARLKRAGVEAAQLEAREILCYVSDKSREQFYRDMQLYVSEELERKAGVPILAYDLKLIYLCGECRKAREKEGR